MDDGQVNIPRVVAPGSRSIVGDVERRDVFDPRFSLGDVDDGQSGFDFWTTLKIFLRWKWLILAIMILGTGLAWFRTSNLVPLYRATVTLEIQKQEAQIFSQNSGLGAQNVADKEFLATQYVLMKSRSLVERVVTRLELYKDADYAVQSASEANRVKQASTLVLENLKVLPIPKSRVVNVQFTSPDNENVARVVNALAENFIESTLERKYSDSTYARDFLQGRLDAAKTSLETFEQELADYAKARNILELGYGENSTTTLDTNAIITLNDALVEARTARVEAEQRYRVLSDNPEAFQGGALMDTPELAGLRNRRSDLKGEYEELLSVYKPEYPRMVQLQDKIEQLDTEIARTQSRFAGSEFESAKAAFTAAKAKEESLERYVRSLKGSLEDYRDRRIQYTILQREVDTARTQYDGLLQRLKDVTIASGVGASQVSIVDRATRPALPFYPNMQMSLIQAFLFSTMLGLGLAWLLTFIDDTIKTPEDIKDRLGLPVLGVIPKVEGNDNMIVKALDDPKSPISEAFFSARTSLEFATDGGSPRSLLITSTQPGEGKTSSIVALATAYSKIGRRVLVIDADMRKPSFIADSEQSIGLSGLLTHGERLSDNVIASNTPGLYLLPSGVIPPNPAELLSGKRIVEIIREAESAFDMVLVDSPPVLNFSDAPVLANICQACIVVIKSGNIRRPAAERTLRRMRENGTRVLGAILMQFDSKRHGYEYGYYYYAYSADAYAYGNTKRDKKASRSAARKIDLFALTDINTDENEDNL